MKKYLCILVLIVFSSLCNAQLVKEVNNKPSTKKVLSLNTMQKTDWSLYYGVQDQNAPQTPNELLKSKFGCFRPPRLQVDSFRAPSRGLGRPATEKRCSCTRR